MISLPASRAAWGSSCRVTTHTAVGGRGAGRSFLPVLCFSYFQLSVDASVCGGPRAGGADPAALEADHNHDFIDVAFRGRHCEYLRGVESACLVVLLVL